jgi:predicted dehydrogenase
MTAMGIGLIGTGYMGKCHALAWNAVAAVFGDVDRPRLAVLAEASLVTDPAVDVVSITTPNAFHPEMAVAALEAGKHVWCEKPMATRLPDAERMLAAARASGKVAALGYNYIQNPVIRLIRRLLDEGRIGEVNHVRLEMDEDFMANPEEFFYWKSEASSGHGALDDFGVHALSLVRILFGGVRRVCGHMAKPSTSPQPWSSSRMALRA